MISFFKRIRYHSVLSFHSFLSLVLRLQSAICIICLLCYDDRTTPHPLTHYNFTYYHPNNKKTEKKTDAAYSSLCYSYSVEMETQIEIDSYSYNGKKERKKSLA